METKVRNNRKYVIDEKTLKRYDYHKQLTKSPAVLSLFALYCGFDPDILEPHGISEEYVLSQEKNLSLFHKYYRSNIESEKTERYI